MTIKKNDQPLVAIWMITYNHERYIEQAVESIVSQQTDFPFMLYIGEDCSTDNTRSICIALKEKYPDRITLLLNEQNDIRKNSQDTFRACFDSGAKYIAMCEGDDYWTDTLKLQKQVEFLEANSSYTICWTRYKELIGVLEQLPDWEIQAEEAVMNDVTFDNLFAPYRTYVVTCMFKRDAMSLETYLKMHRPKDNAIYAMCLARGGGKVQDFYSAVYRKHGIGVWSALNDFEKTYGDYESIKTITQQIAGTDTEVIKSLKHKLLDRAFNLACTEHVGMEQLLLLYKEILLFGPLKQKAIATKEIVRQIALRFFGLSAMTPK